MSPSSAIANYATLQTPAFATTLQIDWSQGDMCAPGVMSANMTITFVNASRGQMVSLCLTQNGTGGFSVTTWPTNIIGAAIPAPATAANAKTIYRFRFDGTNYWYNG